MIALALMTLASCSTAEDQRIAVDAVSQFHDLYNRQSYAAIYTGADDAVHKAGSETDWLNLMSAIRRKLGSYRSSEDAGWGVSKALGGTKVVLNYRSQFAEGAATEQFIFRISSGKPYLVNYYINSPLLILK
jgi:hypothetical protein